jgi:hypothetical protein
MSLEVNRRSVNCLHVRRQEIQPTVIEVDHMPAQSISIFAQMLVDFTRSKSPTRTDVNVAQATDQQVNVGWLDWFGFRAACEFHIVIMVCSCVSGQQHQGDVRHGHCADGVNLRNEPLTHGDIVKLPHSDYRILSGRATLRDCNSVIADDPPTRDSILV